MRMQLRKQLCVVGEGEQEQTSERGVTEDIWVTQGDVRLHSRRPRTRGFEGDLGVLRGALKGTVLFQSRGDQLSLLFLTDTGQTSHFSRALGKTTAFPLPACLFGYHCSLGRECDNRTVCLLTHPSL